MARLLVRGLEAWGGDWLGPKEVEIPQELFHVQRISFALNAFICPSYHPIQDPALFVVS